MSCDPTRPGLMPSDPFSPRAPVSGAPKVRAMELIAELEKEKRGVYAGAVGYFGYGSQDERGNAVEGAMDTCIALRTMMTKDGVAYLQAGMYLRVMSSSLPVRELDC